jgi:hypothetical protein
MTIGPAKDTTIFEENLNSSGAGPHLFAGRTIEEQDRRLLLAFDLSVLPADAVVTDASLTLVVNRSRHPLVPIAIHRLTAEWGEGTSNSGDRGGAGVAATPNDATWRHRLFDRETWTKEGGDFDVAASATTTVNDLGAYTWSSPDLVRDVNEWLSGARRNFGWIFVADGGAKRFHSREGDPASDRPRLRLVFETLTTPAPTALRLFSSSDTGVDGADRITRDNTPTIVGDSVAGSEVTIFAGGVEVGSGPGGPGFSITTSTLGDGENVITAKATRPGGNPGQESEPLRITIDTDSPTVFLERHPDTSNPASGESVLFRVVFSETVGGFVRGDVDIDGTANPRSLRVAIDTPFDGSAYRVEVSGMDSEGTVTASLEAGIVEDTAGNLNLGLSGPTASVMYERFGETPIQALRADLVDRAFAADGVLFEGDVDYVSFAVREAVEVRIVTTGGVDTIGALFDSRQRLLNDPVIDDDLGEGVNFSITRVIGPGLYFVRTMGRAGFDPGTYRLAIDIVRRVALQPDLSIGRGRVEIVGDGIYNLSGSGQSIELGFADRPSSSFRGRLENDGNGDDEISLTSSLVPRGLKFNLRIDGRNVTAGVRLGESRYKLRRGTSVGFAGRVRISGTPGVVPGFRLEAVSLDKRKRDLVRGRVRFPSATPGFGYGRSLRDAAGPRGRLR